MTDCPDVGGLSTEEYFRRFSRKALAQRIPLSGTLDLNQRCNLRCIHCYLGSQAELHQQRHQEMSTAQVCSILDQITAAGCLYLLITGGDPLLRPDFPEIYRHAKTNGLLVTVFTNGTLISDEIAALWSDLPPRLVEISLYGATAATYEKITGVPGSFKRCMAGLKRLRDQQIKFGLKTILMTHNRDEFFAITNIAAEFGVKFRFDAAIFPKFNGDRSPITLRVPAREAIEKELAAPERHNDWQEFYQRVQGYPTSDALYQCGTGLGTFYIDPYGTLQPCLMVKSRQYNLLAGDFLSGWQEMGQIRALKAPPHYRCNHCEKKALCGYCPAFFELETGAADVASKYLCAMGHLRFEALNTTL